MYAKILKDHPEKGLKSGEVYHAAIYTDAPNTVTLLNRVYDGQRSGEELPESAVELSHGRGRRGPSFWANEPPQRISPAIQGNTLRMGLSMQNVGIGYVCMPVANEYEAEQRLLEAQRRLDEMEKASHSGWQ